jgi:PKD repeat protein
MRFTGLYIPDNIGGNSQEANVNRAYDNMKARVDDILANPAYTDASFEIKTVLQLDPQGYFEVVADVTQIRDLPKQGSGPLVGSDFDLNHIKLFFNITVCEPGSRTGPWEVIGYDFFDMNPTEFEDGKKRFKMPFSLQPTLPLDYYTAVTWIQYIHVDHYDLFGNPVYLPPRIFQASSGKITDAVDFVADRTSVQPNQSVKFTLVSLTPTPITSQSWNFGDGSPVSTELNPTHTYTTEGRYDVTLTVNIQGEENPRVITKTNYIIVAEGAVGNISGVWDRDFRVIGDVRVAFGDTLTITEGVTVTVLPGVNFEVVGEIHVLGTKEAPVLFTSADIWRGIHLQRPAGVADNVAQPLSTFEFVTFERSSAALRVTGRNVDISDCIFWNNLSITGSSIAPALDVSGRVVGGASNATANVLRSVFMNNRSGAIAMASSNLNLLNSLVVNNTGNNSGGLFFSFRCNILIENSTIFNNQNLVTPGGTIVMQSTGNNVRMQMINTIIDGSPPIYINDMHGIVEVLSHTAYIDNRSQWDFHPRITVAAGNLLKDAFVDPNTSNPIPIFFNPTTFRGTGQLSDPLDWVLHINSPCIDAGWTQSENDTADKCNPGMALFPARGTIRNDMGFWGGRGGDCGCTVSDVGIEIDLPVNSIDIATFPNPFNPTLTVDVNVRDTNERVNITVFNIRGQKVRELMNETPQSASFRVMWDGKDSNGRNMSSGVYFVNATSAGENSIKKVILMK